MYFSWPILIRSKFYIAWWVDNIINFVSLIFQVYWCSSVQIRFLFFWGVKDFNCLRMVYLDDGCPDRPTTLRLYLGPSSECKFILLAENLKIILIYYFRCRGIVVSFVLMSFNAFDFIDVSAILDFIFIFVSIYLVQFWKTSYLLMFKYIALWLCFEIDLI